MNRSDSKTHVLSSAMIAARAMTLRSNWRRLAVSVILVLALIVGWANQGASQPPGTFPPPELVRPSAVTPESGKIPIKGILFLDSAKNPVLMPGMTYEQLQALESGSKSQRRRYIFDAVKIDGRVDGNRALLTVEVRLKVEATAGDTIAIPLAMENFHRLGSTEFLSGAENGNKLAVSVDQELGGYQLLASIQRDTDVVLRMQMSARVETDSAHSLDFRLPPAPIVIDLVSDSRDVTGEIANRDDEVIRTTSDSAGRSQFTVNSSGGRFTLRWGKMDRPVSVPLLEAESIVTMQWNSPQDQLIQTVEMTVRDLRGSVSSFRFRLPKDAVLVDDPKLTTGGQFGQFVELSKPDPADKELFQVTIPKEERRQRIVLDLRLQLPSDGPSAANELPFQIPVVVGALRHQGTIEIQAGADYRLRWRQRPYVQNVSSAAVDETASDQRVYTFRFNRGAFTLPMWLDATKRELRVTSDCDLEVRDNYVNLTMQIRSIGTGNRSRLLSVDLADWQAPQIVNALTGNTLPWYESGDVIEIEMSTTGMEEIAPVMIRARRSVDPAADGDQPTQVALPLPRVVGSGGLRDPVSIQRALVRLTGKSRRSLVVDLKRSRNLERSIAEETNSGDQIRSFEIMPPESAAQIVGELVERPPRLDLENAAEIKLSGNRLETIVNWNIETQVDLQGRLRIAIPGTRTTAAVAPSTDPDPADATLWTVMVNDQRAQLRPADGSDSQTDPTMGESSLWPVTQYYDLVSDALTEGKMDVRFHCVWPLRFDEETFDARTAVGLPYPLVDDITLRNDVLVQLIGNDTHEITSSKQSLSDKLSFRTFPTSPIPLQITPRSPTQSDLDIEKILIRTAINEVSQHDELIASVVGAGEFELRLRQPGQTDVEVNVNGVPAAFKLIEDRVVIGIPSDAQRHLIDVRLWVDRSSLGLFQEIRPLSSVGPGAAQIYWQLTVPADSHLVWATASVGRAMQWVYDRWRLVRRPLLTDTELINRVATSDMAALQPSPMPSGNRYLFTSMDDRSFRALTGSRTLLWMIVASVIVLITSLVTYIPGTRNPLFFVVAIVAFSGLLAFAPDAAVMVGQIAMLALVLVVVMLAIRTLVLPSPSRVLTTTGERRRKSSSDSLSKPADYRPPSSIAVTHSIGVNDLASSSDEVAS
ncbi:hypothetical protein NHH03_25730 [Stieleria sp. TO1_6]|uniref:hypothetical protein n=1 Tax=Stieleria tagensis TaxID=2956795 RepID=UPI00209B8800|nr:hypothetical protein [Stieleria tagensis]MCO8125163.1 hypothetical protein [Stieleria tagensis]